MQRGDIEAEYVKTQKQLADILTKPWKQLADILMKPQKKLVDILTKPLDHLKMEELQFKIKVNNIKQLQQD